MFATLKRFLLIAVFVVPASGALAGKCTEKYTFFDPNLHSPEENVRAALDITMCSQQEMEKRLSQLEAQIEDLRLMVARQTRIGALRENVMKAAADLAKESNAQIELLQIEMNALHNRTLDLEAIASSQSPSPKARPN